MQCNDILIMKVPVVLNASLHIADIQYTWFIVYLSVENDFFSIFAGYKGISHSYNILFPLATIDDFYAK